MELWDLNDFVCYLELGELLVQSILCAHKIPKHLEKNVEHHQMKCGIIVTLILWGEPLYHAESLSSPPLGNHPGAHVVQLVHIFTGNHLAWGCWRTWSYPVIAEANICVYIFIWILNNYEVSLLATSSDCWMFLFTIFLVADINYQTDRYLHAIPDQPLVQSPGQRIRTEPTFVQPFSWTCHGWMGLPRNQGSSIPSGRCPLIGIHPGNDRCVTRHLLKRDLKKIINH